MSKNNIELSLFGQVLRLYCPPEHQDFLLASAKRLEERVATLKEQSGIIQLEKVLSIVALNLNYELEQEQRKNVENKNVLMSCVQQLDSSLAKFQSSELDSVIIEQENTEK
ncbi:cell division protein ZapA [Otariodibacter oris]|uniref:Cell division protein ZapA n=1 Tax=Otariodibacter oris TaxID=1032623 RepID=A0A420XEZ9_9PAST|nr:cell division protein ZapA [Otariodibacter oris]QGM80173.1 cell division protein ZapA [Otariodibacter oris]RKR70639.1 cell division protein ZapA [Otariodibacter oris]